MDKCLLEKPLDANRYATKKTIAQGMLDIALLTANASQLKYILQVGKEHEFYTLMVTLISVSIILQAAQGILCLVLGSTYNINKPKEQRKANAWNNVALALNVLITGVNVVLSAFDMRSSDMLPAAPAPAATRAAPALPPGLPTAPAPAPTGPARLA
ncbi:hypothetical protein R5R35_013098 [Gryllus longicercus]|uniref:Uncharacterized protein n=1 Tax=Gryllus longicercus TaxID=2509291 RepID=A0AAN9V348_9ORTH